MMILKTLLVAFVAFAVSCSIARGATNIITTTMPDEPDTHGTIQIVWHKVPFNNVARYCLKPFDASCSIIDNHVCHIIAPDSRYSLMHVGRAFVDCVYENKTTAKTIPPFTKEQVSLPISYWFAAREATIDTVCSLGRVNACFKYLSKDHILIVVPVPKTVTNLATVGHEIKHIVDGLWHDANGLPYPDVFLHDKRR